VTKNESDDRSGNAGDDGGRVAGEHQHATVHAFWAVAKKETGNGNEQCRDGEIDDGRDDEE
jgi:hypothetical protein